MKNEKKILIEKCQKNLAMNEEMNNLILQSKINEIKQLNDRLSQQNLEIKNLTESIAKTEVR